MASSVFCRNLLSGKVAVVSGGATGIGYAIASEFLSLGANVVIARRNAEHLNSAVDKLSSFVEKSCKDIQPKVSYEVVDIREESQVRSLFSNVLQQHGQVDILVNNGGGQFPSPANTMRLKGWNSVIETNLTGTVSPPINS